MTYIIESHIQVSWIDTLVGIFCSGRNRVTPAKKTKTESCVQNLRIYYQSVTYIGMDTCPNVLWPPDGCLHSHRYHQRVPETSHDFVCYIPHCTVFWSDWLEGGSIGAEWLNRGRGTVSHSFHLESIFDPDPPQPSGTCNHPFKQ